MPFPVILPYTIGTQQGIVPASELDSNYSVLQAAVNGINDGSYPLSGVLVTGGTWTGGVIDVAYGGTGVTTSTGSGSNVLSIGPTLVAPVLGTPASITLTNANGLPVGGIAATGTPSLSTYLRGDGTWSVLDSPVVIGSTAISGGTSGHILYDNSGVVGELPTTGSGSVVLNNGATLVSPALGTPVSVTLTNATGLPVGGISATGTPSSSTFLRGDGSWATVLTGLSIGTTPITGGTTGRILYDNAGTLGELSAVPIANGGTGQATASAAFNALSPITTAGDLIIGSGPNAATRLAIGSNTYILTSNGTTATWAPPPATGITVNATAITGGTTGRVLYDNAGTVGELANTGSGNNVLATSPTLVTPNLGTPSVLTLTNATGLPVGGISATGTPSSSTYLRGDGAWVVVTTGITVNSTAISGGTSGRVLYDNAGTVGELVNTGTGNNVLATSPTLVTPALGVPTSLTLTNATGLPVGGISATGTPSSTTYLRGDGTWAVLTTGITINTTAITGGTTGRVLYDNAGTVGELATTGSGNVVLATSPTLVTPVLGTPTSVTLTNATGLPVGGISATGTPSSSTYLRGDGSWATISAFSYPGSGIVVSTGSAWGTSLTAPSGAIVGTTDTQTLTNKRITMRIGNNSSPVLSGNYTFNSDNFDQIVFNGVNGALSILNDAGTPTDGQKVIFRIYTAGGSSYALSFPTTGTNPFRAVGTVIPTLTTTTASVLYIGCLYNANAATWDVVTTVQQ